jgi:hypothetical protein
VKKRLFILNVLVLLAVFSVARGENESRDNAIQKDYEFSGALDIRIHATEGKLYPSAELLLIDPEERKTGHDPRIDKSYMGIPSSSYEEESISDAVTSAPGPVTKIIDIRNPSIGEYVLKVIGKEPSAYDLEIRGYDCEMNPSHEKFMHVKIDKDSEHEYIIRYSNRKGSNINVSSGKK